MYRYGQCVRVQVFTIISRKIEWNLRHIAILFHQTYKPRPIQTHTFKNIIISFSDISNRSAEVEYCSTIQTVYLTVTSSIRYSILLEQCVFFGRMLNYEYEFSTFHSGKCTTRKSGMKYEFEIITVHLAGKKRETEKTFHHSHEALRICWLSWAVEI